MKQITATRLLAAAYGIVRIGSLRGFAQTEPEQRFPSEQASEGNHKIRKRTLLMSAKKLVVLSVLLFCTTWVIAQRAPAGGAAPAGSASGAGQSQAPRTATPPTSTTTPPPTSSTAPPPTASAPSSAPGSNPTNSAAQRSTQASTTNPHDPNAPATNPAGSPCGTSPATPGTAGSGSSTQNPGSSS